MSDIPLQYESLRTIIQHMEANFRFRLVTYVPTIRNTEKAVPIKINNLALDDTKTTVNDVTYKLGVYIEYKRESETSPYIKTLNLNGGSSCEMDKYGHETSSKNCPLTPGDLDLRGPGWKDKFPSFDHEQYEQQLNALYPFNREIDRLGRPGFFRAMNHYRINNVEPPFTRYIRLTVTSSRDVLIEQMEYTKPLHYAVKYMNASFFGRRPLSMEVRDFSIPKSFTVVRLPADLRIKSKRLDIGYGDVNKVAMLLDDSSYPLDVLTFADMVNYDHVAFKTAKKIDIFYFLRPFNNLFDSVKSPTVIVKYDCLAAVGQHIFRLIRDWKKKVCPVGFSYSFGSGNEENPIRLLARVEAEFEFIEKQERSLILPINDLSVIVVSYEDAGEYRRNMQWGAENWKQLNWFFKLEVKCHNDQFI